MDTFAVSNHSSIWLWYTNVFSTLQRRHIVTQYHNTQQSIRQWVPANMSATKQYSPDNIAFQHFPIVEPYYLSFGFRMYVTQNGWSETELHADYRSRPCSVNAKRCLQTTHLPLMKLLHNTCPVYIYIYHSVPAGCTQSTKRELKHCLIWSKSGCQCRWRCP